MRKVVLAVSVMLAITLGCSSAARERLKHWFFEVPEQPTAAVTAEEPAGAPDEAPRLVLAEPKYKSVHMPYQDRQCRRCHDEEQRMSVREDMPDICLSCHRQYFDEDNVEHSPVADAECLSCHDLHRSERTSLLKQSMLEACGDCHDGPEDLSEEAHGGEGVEDCTACHDPHFGEAPYLKTVGQTAAEHSCVGCHSRPENLSRSAHSGEDAGNCTACHVPHLDDQMPASGLPRRGTMPKAFPGGGGHAVALRE